MTGMYQTTVRALLVRVDPERRVPVVLIAPLVVAALIVAALIGGMAWAILTAVMA